MVPACFPRRDSLTGMQHDLHGSPLAPRDLDGSSSSYVCFEASRREKHDGFQFSPKFICSKLYAIHVYQTK